MTANQINYAKAREEARANMAKEQLTREANWEAQRHNLRTEQISHMANEEQARHNTEQEKNERERNTLNYQASVYASQVSQRNAELGYASSVYGSQMSAAASRYAADVNYAGTQLNVDQRDREMWTDYNTASMQDSTNRRGQDISWRQSVLNTVGGLVNTVYRFALPIMFGKT